MTRIHALVFAVAALALSACNTVSGAGEDISAGGDAISDTADSAEREISE